jgi:hypothetical protein
MISPYTDTSLRQAALVAGLGLVAMTTFAVAAIYIIFPKLIVPGDATLTVNNLIADEMLFRIGIGSLVVVAILDLVVAWALYIFLEPVNRGLSLLAAWFRLAYASILIAALFSYINVIQILSGADNLIALDSEQLHAGVMRSINGFDDNWAIGLQFFGLHLVLLGYLIFKSDYIPGILGVVLIAAGLGYLIDNFGMLISPNYDLSISTFVGWGELLLVLWLLLRGVNVQREH